MIYTKADDFLLNRVENPDTYCDCWFTVIGDTKEELFQEYMEQGVIEIPEAVFSISDEQCGVKRRFLFSYDVMPITVNEELYGILKELAIKEYEKWTENGASDSQ
jgi:hypothetical protein